MGKQVTDPNKVRHMQNVLDQLKFEGDYQLHWWRHTTHVWVYEVCNEQKTELALIDNNLSTEFIAQARARGFFIKPENRGSDMTIYHIH